MQHEPGDEYIRRIASYIRANEAGLAAAGVALSGRRQRPKAAETSSVFNPLGWFDTNSAPSNVKPALGYDVESPSRPMNYISIPGADRSDALSFRSFTSTLTAVSKLSLGAGCLDAELKYIYSIHAPEPRMIAELANDPIIHALPLYAFKNPRTLIGWDKLSISLRSLSIKRSGLEDVSDARAEGRAGSLSHSGSFRKTRLPDSVPEDVEDAPSPLSTPKVQEASLPNSPSSDTPELPSLSWSALRYLSLAENALTFLPTSPLPHLTSVTHLDLSSNLLVSVPPGLSALYSLVSLNLSDNMIDSVLGIYTMLGQVLRLNLSRNRLESICGLERLLALERESAEIGRLATLPNITEVWVEGNPLTEIEEGYRIRCFDQFWKEGKTIILDGSPAGFYEKRYLTSPPPEQMASARATPAAAPSPPVVPVVALAAPAHSSPGVSPSRSAPTSQGVSPQTAAIVARGRKKKNKRSDASGSRSGSHARNASEPSALRRTASPAKPRPHPPELQAKVTDAPQPPKPLPTTTSSATPLPPPKFFSPPTTPSLERDSVDLSSSPPSTDRRASAHRRSATMSSKSAVRRGRVSASMYEPPTPGGENEDTQFSEAEAFRQRIEALRSDMGEGWLKVFNQSHLASPKPTLPGVTSG
ncbi:hypothetical protein BC629DRAFT_1538210 [Irpex lacteus]|nr:hypothetical protein BC629DRAFT_1538210 [Irpex lacteus]